MAASSNYHSMITYSQKLPICDQSLPLTLKISLRQQEPKLICTEMEGTALR